MPYNAWPFIADKICAATAAATAELDHPPHDPSDPRLAALQTQGIASLGRVLDPAQLADVQRHFAGRPKFAGHVFARSGGAPHTAADALACYRLADVLQAPHILELANRADILTLMEAYLGCTPTLYSVNAFWSFPNDADPVLGLQTFHRDFDDFRFCTLFLWLTDTSPQDGAHYFIRGTHRADLIEATLGPGSAEQVAGLFALSSNIEEARLAAFRDRIETVSGPAGSAVLENTYGLHKGEIPKAPRLLLWIRYGLFRNVANFADKIEPVARELVAGRIPDTARHRYINRLIVEP